MSVRTDCRHYSTRTVGSPGAQPGNPLDVIQRCKVDAATPAPFSCPEHCLFFEERSLGTGWQIG